MDLLNLSSSTISPISNSNDSNNDGAKTTTLGTIVVRSGPIQLVIALLQSPDVIYIKLIEIEPKLTALGNNIEEAVCLQKDHEALLQQLQKKTSPIEEFIEKAEKYLSTQSIDQTTVESMGETLNIIWNEILKLVHKRKYLLNTCANFHEKMGSCRGKMESLEIACKDTMIPIEIEAVQDFLNNIKKLRIDVLTAVMSALKEGNELLAQLQEIAESGTIDSRPDHVKRDAIRAISQVQLWLENLHDRRNTLESAWQTRKIQLEQCLALAILAKDLISLQENVMFKWNEISKSFNLGECQKSTSTELQTYINHKENALIYRDRALKITRTTEKLISSGCIDGNDVSKKAYNVLNSSIELLELVDRREHQLQQSKNFFCKSEKILALLEQLEIEASSTKYPNNSPEYFALHSRIFNDMKSVTEESLKLGYSLLDEIGPTQPEVKSIKRTLEEIENRKVYIERICLASLEEKAKSLNAMNLFMTKYNELLSWLVSIAEAFLRANQTLGLTLPESEVFLHLHHQLMQDLENKGETINKILFDIKSFHDSLEPPDRYDVDMKAESLQKHWCELKDLVIKRVDLVSLYIEFFKKADKLNNMFRKIEENLRKTEDFDIKEELDTAWSEIKTAYGSLKGSGHRFLNFKIADPYLETQSACLKVEEILNEFRNHQLDISSSWEKRTQNLIQRREIEILIDTIMNAHTEIMNNKILLDNQLYPILSDDHGSLIELKENLSKKLEKTLQDIDKAQTEITERIQQTTLIQGKDQSQSERIDKVNASLLSLKSRLENIKFDYQALTTNILKFLEGIIELDTTIENYFSKNQLVSMNYKTIDRDFVDYEKFRESIMAKFRTLISQSEKLIDRVRVLEPQEAKEIDTDQILRMLEKLRTNFEYRNELIALNIQKVQNLSMLRVELEQIINNFKNLSKQLHEIKNQKVESLASAKTKALAFEYFERTVETFEKTLQKFMETSTELSEQSVDDADKIKRLISDWKVLKEDIKSTRNQIVVTNEHYELLEKIKAEIREISSYYASTTTKISSLNEEFQALNLINDIERYTSLNEPNLVQSLKQLSLLSNKLYGLDNTQQIHDDIKSLFLSFDKLKSDIKEIVKSIKLKENHLKESDKNIEKTSEIEQMQDLQIISMPPKFTRPLYDKVVHEGEKALLECELHSVLKPHIEWLKDGISIQSNPDYLTKFCNGICTLQIEETFADDSGKFSCCATNDAGITETSAILRVEENNSNEQFLSSPKILKPLEDGIAREGSTFQFTCIVTGNPLPSVMWYRNEKCIDDSPDFCISFNNGEAILKLEEVFLEDNASFTCKISNPAGVIESSANLKVEPLEPTEGPHFKTELSNIMARVGQKIKLECDVSGIPIPKLSWTHNGKPFTERDVKYNIEHVTLIIPEAYPKDAGLYVVIAKNLAGEAFSSCNISVKGRLPNETSDSEVASDMEPIKPLVQLPLKNIFIFEGKPVRLDCVIIGQPEPEVIWYHDDRPVKESNEIRLLFQGDRCSLIIQEAFVEDSGTYKVVAINAAGEASSSCEVKVTSLNIAEPPAIRVKNVEDISNELAPKFEKFLTDVLANEGDTVTLECFIIGKPIPEITWYHCNEKIEENENVSLEDDRNGTVKLIIKSATISDKGVYTVKASNLAGEAKCFSQLIVRNVNVNEVEEQVQLHVDEHPVGPKFKVLLSDQKVHLGESAKFECIVIGKPKPKIKWLFNDKPVQGKNFLISTSGDRQVLSIPLVNCEIVGKVSCVAENEIGKATCVANMELIDNESNMKIHNHNEEHDTESSKISLTKQIISSITTSEVQTTENKVPLEEANKKHYQSSIGFGNGFLETNASSKLDETNKNNIPKLTSVLEKGQRKPFPPRFINPLIGKIIDQGLNVTLEATFDGYPLPEFVIQKNNSLLLQSDRIHISHHLNKISIEIINVGVRDAGKYSITATNLAGVSTSCADLVVKKTIFPPVFGHRLQAQVAKRGERTVMEVEVTGMPEPTIRWYKNNKILEEGVISEHKTKSEGNRHTLIIEKAQVNDSGKYMVMATNAGGQAQSIADFAVLERTPERMVEVVKTVVYDDMKDFKDIGFETDSAPFYNSNLQSETKSEINSTTTSSVLTEHRCTTEAVMRMEHKTSCIEIPEMTNVKQLPKSENVHKIDTFNKTAMSKSFPIKNNFECTTTTKQSEFKDLKNIMEVKLNEDQEYNIFNDKEVESVSKPVPLYLKPGSPPKICFIPEDLQPITSFSEKIPSIEKISDKFEMNKNKKQENGLLHIDSFTICPPVYSTPKALKLENHNEQFNMTSKKDEVQNQHGLTVKDAKQLFEEKTKECQVSTKVSNNYTSLARQEPNLIGSENNILKFSKDKNIYLEPGAQPEIGYAPKPMYEYKQTLKETIEHTLKQDLQKLPTKVVPCSVPAIPIVPKESFIPLNNKTLKMEQNLISVAINTPEASKKICKDVNFPGKVTQIHNFVSPKTISSGSEHESEGKLDTSERSNFCFRSVKPPTPNHNSSSYFTSSNKTPSFDGKNGYAADTEDTTPGRNFEMQTVEQRKQLFEKKTSLVENTTQISDKQNYNTSSLVKNISMKRKEIKINQQPVTPRPDGKNIGASTSPCPVNYLDSDYGSDYNESSFKKTKEFEEIRTFSHNECKYDYFEEIKSPRQSKFTEHLKTNTNIQPKLDSVKSKFINKAMNSTHIHKPKPIIAPPKDFTTRYYTAIAGVPLHQTSATIENLNEMETSEINESCHRIVNTSQTRNVIHSDIDKKSENYIDTFKSTSSPKNIFTNKQSIPIARTPTKFIPGDFRESDYESEVENARIRPLWTPNFLNNSDPQYRHVQPPRSTRSISLPRTYERVQTPMEYENSPTIISPKITTSTLKSRTLEHNYYPTKTFSNHLKRDDADITSFQSKNSSEIMKNEVSKQMKSMTSSFQQKTHKFKEYISNDPSTQFKPTVNFNQVTKKDNTSPQMYNEASKISPNAADYTVPNAVNTNQTEELPKRPPLFVTPLKDIAVMLGQTARFACIVKCEPHPDISWWKDGVNLSKTNKYDIEFKNGVCHLSIHQASLDDAGRYSCRATNILDSVTTSAELFVPGNKFGI